MLACALANTVKQVGESFEYSNPSPGSYNQIFYDTSGMNCIPGDAFYLAAKKRLGLLDVTLTSVQCFFLAGLYESDFTFPVVELSETFEKSSTSHQRPGEHVWLANVEHVMAQAILQEHELDQWRTILPKTLEFDPDDGAPEDLAFILECRQLQWRQISYRPLLYYALHKPDTDPYFDRVLPLAQKCLQYCALTIKRLTRPHYYEATWFSYRAISTATLLILAAQLRGPPLYVHNWQALVSLSLRVLAARTARAAYIDPARPVLETLLKHVTKDHE
ncbi:hypothetical protein Trihar35433_7825 [Trichoderma harzianum]|nr:hypothetical protein Trihar35433_7825 [Trichoderma harzianum]